MSEIFKLVAKLTLDTSDFDKKTDDSKEKASVFGDVLKADLVGKGISAVIDGFKQAVGAIADFTKQAVNSYSEYEQLSGGIQKLFGAGGLSLEQYAEQQGKSVDEVRDKYNELITAQDAVMKHAAEAYKTAGMSANEYMENVSGFSAALVNALGGDTVAAAESADMAMRAISDNVNTFGTDMGSVQNAFQGFAKQNYTMLDNLKLGYGGTKSEMERLISDANEYAESIGEAGDLSIDSFADIVTAIELVQEKQGIAGTTAREASKTIEGSITSMKAAWENLVAGIANPDADLGLLVDNMVASAETALDNILPAVERAFGGMGEVITKVAPVLVQKIPELVSRVAPSMGEAAVSLVTSFADAIADMLPDLWDMGSEFLTNISEGFKENFPTFVEQAMEALTEMTSSLSENVGTFLDVGIEIILNLLQGIMDSLPTLIESVPQIFLNLTSAIIENLPTLIGGAIQMVWTLRKGIIDAIPSLLQAIPQIFSALFATWTALDWGRVGQNAIEAIKAGIQAIINAIPDKIKEIGKKAIDWFKDVNWTEAGTKAINKIVDALQSMFSDIPNKLKSIANDAKDKFKSIDWWDVGSQVINGIANGIWDGAGKLIDAAKNAAKNAFEAAKDFLGIESPSKLFREKVGRMISQGLAIGIDLDADKAVESAENMAKSIVKPFDGLDLGVNTPTLETTLIRPTEEQSQVVTMLGLILTFLQENMNNGEPIPIVLDGGLTVGYYDKALGVKANMRRRGVI